MDQPAATTAATSGLALAPGELRELTRRSDLPGLLHLGGWVTLLGGTGWLLHLSLGSAWLVPALLLHGALLSLTGYAISHETAHRTAFRTRWLNETLFWLSSLLYYEEPNHRRFAHARHHTYTSLRGHDGQFWPAEAPMGLATWIREVSGLSYWIGETRLFVNHAMGRFAPETLAFVPDKARPRLVRGARICLAVYAALPLAAWALGLLPALLLYVLLPRVLGGPFMLLVTLTQHGDKAVDDHDLRLTCRSVRSNRLMHFLYWNMSWHVEHHSHPTVPFHALPRLSAVLRERLPAPSDGFVRTSWRIFVNAARRSIRGRNREPQAA